jgi:hypothetical protein
MLIDKAQHRVKTMISRFTSGSNQDPPVFPMNPHSFFFGAPPTPRPSQSGHAPFRPDPSSTPHRFPSKRSSSCSSVGPPATPGRLLLPPAGSGQDRRSKAPPVGGFPQPVNLSAELLRRAGICSSGFYAWCTRDGPISLDNVLSLY